VRPLFSNEQWPSNTHLMTAQPAGVAAGISAPVGRLEPVVIVLIVVAPVDTAYRYLLAGTEMRS
jgi:hypothetical protein